MSAAPVDPSAGPDRPHPVAPGRCTVLPSSARHAQGWVVREQEVRRSRFLAVLGRVEEEGQARAMVAELRRRHHDARHVCSAFVLGATRSVARSSDDGEPAGTAGAPMLDALLARQTRGPETDLTDVCAVVVRWFGGVKLGAGGLVRAYSDAVSAVLDTTPLVTRERMALLSLAAPHAAAGRWENELRAAGVVVLGTDYAAADARVRLACPDAAADLQEIAERVAAVTAGAGVLERTGEDWMDHE